MNGVVFIVFAVSVDKRSGYSLPYHSVDTSSIAVTDADNFSAYTPRYSGGSMEEMRSMTCSVDWSISSRVIFLPFGVKIIGSPKVIVMRGRNCLNDFSLP